MDTETRPEPRPPGRLRRVLLTPAAPGPLLPGLRSRWARGLALAGWLALAYVFIGSGSFFLSDNYTVSLGGAFALYSAQVLPMVLAPFRPLPWWVVAFGVSMVLPVVARPVGGQVQPWPWPPSSLLAYLALLAVLATRSRRLTLIGVWLATAAGSLLVGRLAGTRPAQGNLALVLVLSAVVLIVGDSVRARREAQARAAAAQTAGERERARRELLEERTRIARELHDVVAHHMSVITVQAESAPYRLQDLPGPAREEFASIAAAARESLGEMRRLLGVLRSEERAAERAPQPDLERLPQLVETAARAGIPVELHTAEEVAALGELPPAVGLSAYRIVQEALSNVVRHAPGAPTRVSLAAGADTLRVTVVNGPPPDGAAGPGGGPGAQGRPLEQHGTGQGLTGMRERVAMLGGSLETGPVDSRDEGNGNGEGGGFKVEAVLPIRVTA